MKALFAALCISAAIISAPAIAADATSTAPAAAPSRQAQCGAIWRGNKATLAPVHGTWSRFWSACAGAMKAGADPLKAPAKPAKLKAAAAPAACVTDSECERLNPAL